jgi:serpin B
VDLSLPSFDTESTPDVERALKGMGMALAFTDQADFTPMAGNGPWGVTGVQQKAFIHLNENGTEAGAATGVTAAATGSTITVPPPAVTIDHPFLYLIRDLQTNAILFAGQEVDPSKGSTP